MKIIYSLFVLVSALATTYSTFAATESRTVLPTDFEVGDGTFLLGGEPFVIKAAELHYPRIPKEYWEHRIKMCKSLGMNTICLYVFWNVHEEEPDKFDFTGQKDLRAFVKLCEENDMKVILRPGPYVCAEWEMGGLPWWLLKDKDISLRESDPRFMERVEKFQKAVAEEVADLTAPNGGPIIMVQVENEYGSYGTDKTYVSGIRDILRDNFGEVTMFQCDWDSNFLNNGLDDLLWTLNFGTGANIDQQFSGLKAVRPTSPLMCSEFWSGWFDKWGAGHENRPAEDMTKGIEEMLDKGISFSLYMTHGGTNWGHWAGANSPGFAPDVTSYDYDAPINEYGRATPKYHLLRDVMSRHAGGKELPPLPDSIPTIHIPEFQLQEFAPLFSNLGAGIKDDKIRSMEEYNQGFGSILYRTNIPPVEKGTLLIVEEPHDYAQIFIDGAYVGKLDRRKGETTIELPTTSEGCTLDILVEAMGRINFGRAIKDFKGITEKVTLSDGNNARELNEWTVYNLPDTYSLYDKMGYEKVSGLPRDNRERLPAGVYRGTFNLSDTGDTFLNFENWGKGLVYVNGYPLGRIWEIGPQQTLYMPGCWLKQGDNEIMVFDIVGPHDINVEGLRTPVLDKLNKLDEEEENPKSKLDTSLLTPCAVAEFKEGNGWQHIRFTDKTRGRYLIIEPLDAIDGGDIAAIAEVYLTDDNGRMSREKWKAIYADSEDKNGANRTSEKVYDLQESTSWTTAPGVAYPHMLIVDLGEIVESGGLDYLPRMEAEVPGGIRSCRIYLLENL